MRRGEGMKFLDLFAGIGGFRLGMEAAGHECVGYVEWDKYARKSYEAIHKTEGEWTAHDITGVTDNDLRLLKGKGIDVICGGFPCQSFSVAGKRGGFDDTRGTMFFEIARFAEQIKPRILFLENVKGLLSHDQGNTFGTILNTLDELGYDCEWQVLNSSAYAAQSRERVYIIGHLRGERRSEVFPFTNTGTNNLIKIIDGHQTYRVYSPAGLARTLMGEGGNLNDKAGQYLIGGKIRRLTPKECFRLQGFPDVAFDKAAEVTSDSQLYKQAGNSVTVNVIHEIAKRL